MDIIIKLVLLVDMVFAIKIIGSVIRSKIRGEDYVNNKLWARVGILILFHLIMFVVSGFVLYITAIVNATL